MRHFVQHVQDADIPADTKPLARLCESDWSPDVQQPVAATTTATMSSEKRNRDLLPHATKLEAFVYYTVPAPAAMTTQQRKTTTTTTNNQSQE
jgi:hypothetical protein